MRGRGQQAWNYVVGEGRHLASAVAGTGSVQVAAMAASFLVGVLLARGLGVKGFGYYAIAQSVITLAGIPSEMGVPRLVTREVAASTVRKDYPRFYGVLRWADGVVLRISALILAGLIVASILIARLRPSPLALALVAGAPVIPLMALSRIRGGALQGLGHIVRGQIPANLMRPVAQSVLLLCALAFGLALDPSRAMALNSLAAATVFLVARHWLKTRLPARTEAEPVREGRHWLASSVPMALTQGMLAVQTELSVLLVGFITLPAEAGLFRIASAVATAAAAASAITIFAGSPAIARLYAEGDRKRLQKAVTFFAWVQFGGIAVLAVPLFLAAEWFLALAFGTDFAAAAVPLRLLLVGQLLNAAFGPNGPVLNMTRHEQRVTRAMGIGFVVNVLAVPLLTLRFGVAGAAIGLVASTLCWNLIAWRDARRLVGIETSVIGAIARA